MQKLIAELHRLYLPAGAVPAYALAPHLQGQATLPVRLTTDAGLVKAMALGFDKVRGGAQDAHWTHLCLVANALQNDLGLPAPAVSISGDKGYGLWLSFAPPVPKATAQQFLQALQQAYFADGDCKPDTIDALVELPPCLHQRTGKWAAFIHPGMGASFADEAGLEMAPPFTGQAAFLEKLESITSAQLAHAMDKLAPAPAPTPEPEAAVALVPMATPPACPVPGAAADTGLLLQHATLDDIVRWLHARNIEPTFRHLIAPGIAPGMDRAGL